MGNEAKVSVVIPVYNTEKYVREAVESIRRQTLKELEIIIINDGSTDRSLEILEELATADNRIQVYSQTNQGQSVARNVGIAHVCGKYIYFMDSDDLLKEQAIEMCYRKCEAEQLDFVFFDASSFHEDTVKNIHSTLNYKRADKLEKRIYTGQEAFKAQLQNREFTSSPCLNLVRKHFLEDNHLLFHPGIVHEDQLFTALLYLQAERVACINQSFFLRRIREDSTMTRKFSLRNLEGYLTVTHEILDFKKQSSNSTTQAIIDLYLSQMLDSVVWQAHSLRLQSRLRLAWLCLFRYKRYVSTRSIGILLFKTFIHKQPKETCS